MQPEAMPSLPRRRLLAAATLSAVTSARAADPPFGRAHPRDVGRKFDADGTPLPFEGNTFAGHVGQQGADYETFDAWLDIVREMPRHGFSRKLTLVPPSSWHVTLIGGVNDVDRTTPAWPTDLARDTPISQVHRTFLERLHQRRARPLEACRFVVDTERPPRTRIEGTLAVPLRPADAADAKRLGAARDELADLIRLRRPDHDTQRFHVTIGYLYRLLDATEAAAMQAAAADWISRLAVRGPLRIGAFHFCVLRDMFAYREMRAV
ncbi:MAG TPA: DUF1868 domain-containing protein [Albitalea sp.]|uniref:DUF1868 domain-containing protein n=1 Tax=Piscinibacter sp. TaxID=1903157 RepID=UPI002ED16149